MMFRRFNIICLLLNIAFGANELDLEGFCTASENDCRQNSLLIQPMYFLYDVNQPEGFNLRRDVYMRMAIFIKDYITKTNKDWHLVLPPWTRLYHWQSKENEVGSQDQLFWNLFFDVSSLKSFVPVVEMYEFVKDADNLSIDMVIILQHYPDIYASTNKQIDWRERWEEDENECTQRDSSQRYIKSPDGSYSLNLWNYKNITAKHIQCVMFQGDADLIGDILERYNPRTVIFDHAEVALHSHFGDANYWRCRQSMRFNKDLIGIASEFRNRYLNSDDVLDNTVRPDDWRDEASDRDAIGGPYLAVHLRRRDFVHSRSDKVPSIKSAAKQISGKLDELHLSSVFIATDAPSTEYSELKSHLHEYNVYRYIPSETTKRTYKDGGTAIIDQIICSNARYFIGTCESTFSFRIQEEREILGLNHDTTFNCLCPKPDKKCAQPTRWKIVY